MKLIREILYIALVTLLLVVMGVDKVLSFICDRFLDLLYLPITSALDLLNSFDDKQQTIKEKYETL